MREIVLDTETTGFEPGEGDRIVEIGALPGDLVEEGDVLIKVESRQFGDPPPVVDIKAPLSGMVTEAHVRLGEPVEPAKEMMDIVDLNQMWAVARVPEDYAAGLKPGAKARIRVAALGDRVFDGELLRFGTTADTTGGTIDAIFTVPNPELRMRPGMRAEFFIVEKTRENVMSVPKEAVQGTATDPVLFIKDYEVPNGFRRLPIQLGERNDEFVEIVGGLFPGDEVVVEGSYPLSFVSGGGISLKEALDAAHGHEHAEDGSELTAEQLAERARMKAGGAGSVNAAPVNRFLLLTCGVLAVLLVLSLLMRRKPQPSK